MKNSFFEKIKLTPLAIINAVALLIFLVLLWNIYSFYIVGIQLPEREKSVLEVEQVQEKILFHDEILTMSVRMAVMTGELSWETHYRDAKKKLDENIIKAEALFPNLLKAHIEKNNDANKKIIAFENKAFELVTHGETDDAKELLFSDEYELYRQQYSEAVASVHKKLDQLIKAEQEKNESAQIKYFFSIIVIAFVFIFAWISLNLFLRQGRVEFGQKEQLLKSILDNAVDGIISIDKRGIILSANPATERLFGYEQVEMIGQNVKMLMPTPYHEEHDGYLKNYHETSEKKIIGIGREVIGKRKDGSTFPMELSVSENKIGDSHSFTGIVRDISERKQAEEELLYSAKEIAETGDFLKGILDNAVDGIISIDKTGMILAVNPATERLFGYAQVEMMGQNVKMLMPTPYHEEHDGYLKNYHETSEKKIIGIGREVIGKRKDGSTFPMELSVSENKIGDSHSFTGIVRDISERKAYEKNLTERTVELERSNEELERFAYVASHDLQEPLRMVASYTNLLSKRYKDKLDDDANDFIKYSVDGAKRMQTLINDLLAFSRLNNISEEFSVVDTDVLVEEVIEVVKNLGKNVVITKDKLPEVKGLKVTLHQLFQNIIFNAVKYSDPDRKNEIHISAERQNEKWVFSISDTGIGIAPEYFEKIFVIFKRLHNKDTYSGTGIGLALCKKIVEQHGGKIWIEPASGKGSIFMFTLLKR